MPRTVTPTRLSVEALEAREVPATVFAVNQAGRLLTFDSNNPSVLLSGVTITGLSSVTEKITDIDVRPGGGLLYGRSTAGFLYTINPVTGLASRLPGVVTVDSTAYGIDFDPTIDRLRIVSNLGQNIAVNPNDGTLASVFARLSYLPGDVAAGQAPRVTGLGFTNSLPFALTTTGYGIDHLRNTLVRYATLPQTGQLITIGSLGFDVTALVGFDIPAGSTIGFATFRTPGSSSSIFCQVNLATGAATVVGPVGNFRLISDIAVQSGAAFPPGGVFLSPPGTTTGLNTTPLFPTLVQPLAPGLVSPGFGITFSTTTTTTGTNNTFFPPM